MKKGYVYILSNASMPNVVKVGYTMVDPRKRASELFTTGVPSPFTVEFAILVDDPHEIEKEFHEEYERFRSPKREFFSMPVDEAIIRLFNKAVIGVAARYEDEVLDEGDHLYYSAKANVHPFSLMNLLEEVTEDEWLIFAGRHKKRLEARKRRREQDK